MTGVQTCALPISACPLALALPAEPVCWSSPEADTPELFAVFGVTLEAEPTVALEFAFDEAPEELAHAASVHVVTTATAMSTKIFPMDRTFMGSPFSPPFIGGIASNAV